MENDENTNSNLSVTSEVDEALAVENFVSTSNQIDPCESPTTSTNANKQKTVSTVSTAANAETNVQSEEPKCAVDETGAAASAASLDCPICLQACIHPARLPCGHIFCFLCIKGVAYKNQRCAMCRREIPAEFLERPQLVNGADDLFLTKCTEDGYQWFYEGRNGGWWEYDKRSSDEIEEVYKAYLQTPVLDLTKSSNHDMLISGTIYSIDFVGMLQFPKNAPNRRRKIRRANHMPTKGVAGWWQYDVRTSQDIEDAYKKGEKSCTILVAGYVYTVDLETMVQQRQNEPTRCRRVKRDLATVPKKGVAGLRLEGNNSTASDADSRGNVASNRQDRNFSPTDDASISDLSVEDIDYLTQSHDFASGRSTEDNVDLATAAIPLNNLQEQQNSTENTNFASFVPMIDTFQTQSAAVNIFPNTVQSNARESDQRSDDEFQETLNNLQQLTLRAADSSSSTQNEPNERQENRYRNNRC